MKKIHGLGLIAALMFYTQVLYSQPLIDSSKEKKLRSFLTIKLGFNDGVQWEQKITKTSAIDIFAGLSIGLAADGFSFSNFKAPLIVSPAANIEYRNYYNFKKRISKQKKTLNNGANFLFGRLETYFPVKNQNYFNLLFTQGWGTQRSLCRKINVNYHIGMVEHLYYDKPPFGGFNYVKIEPISILSFYYVF